jgi:hypothetical protein
MRRFIPTAGLVAAVLAGCGGGGTIEGTLAWSGSPRVGPHGASGVVRNTTSHSVTLDPKAMRLLDASGRKVRGRFTVERQQVEGGGSVRLVASWRSGKPVRIDYGTGALALPSG